MNSFVKIAFLALVALVVVDAQESLVGLVTPQVKNSLPPTLRSIMGQTKIAELKKLPDLAKALLQQTDPQQALNIIKANVPKLAGLAEQGIAKAKELAQKIEAQLTPETKDVLSQLGQVAKNAGQNALDIIKSKAPQLKQNLQQAAPQVAALLDTPAAQAIAQKLA